MTSSYEAPSGWAWATVAEVGSVSLGRQRSPANHSGPYMRPYLRSANITWAGLDLSDVKEMNFDEADFRRFRLEVGDVLLNEGSGSASEVGKPAIWRGEIENCCFQNTLLRVKPGAASSDYLRHYFAFSASSGRFIEETQGVNIFHIGKDGLAKFPIPVPPLAEQRRIVAKLDALTARTARARADLDRIPALAARYKQAVLVKAFNGELTAEWRAGKPNLMSAEVIRSVVGESWAAFQAPTSRRRGPLADPEAGRQPLALGVLPDNWAQMDLASVTNPARLIQYGILKPGEHIENGVPYVKVMNIKRGVVELDKIRKTTPAIHEAYRRSSLHEGDLLLTIRGTVGRLAEVPAALDGGNITQDSVRIAVLPVVNRRFVYWFLHSPLAQGYFVANQKGVAVRGINVGDVRPMELPVCSPEEQEEVVRRVEHTMVEIDRLTAEAAAARRLLNRLDQSILSKAFRGELVPQDPGDEPASVLLDRIRTERAAAPKAKRGRRAAV